MNFVLFPNEVHEDRRAKARAGTAFRVLSGAMFVFAAINLGLIVWLGLWDDVADWLFVALFLCVGLGSFAQADTLHTAARLFSRFESPAMSLSPEGVRGQLYPESEYQRVGPGLWSVRSVALRLLVARVREPNALPWTTLVLNVQEARSGGNGLRYTVGLLSKRKFDSDGCGLVGSLLGPFLINKSRSGGGVRGSVVASEIVGLMEMAQQLGADFWIGRRCLSSAGRAAAATLPFGTRLLQAPVRGYSEVSIPMPQTSATGDIGSWLASTA